MSASTEADGLLGQASQLIDEARRLLSASATSDKAKTIDSSPSGPPSFFEMPEFFDPIRQHLFGGKLIQDQVDGIKSISALCVDIGLCIEQTAYVLASCYHESAHTMQPVRETLSGSDEQAIARLEHAWRNGKLPWVEEPYWRKDAAGKSWFGRGLIQITHEENYDKQQRKLADHPRRESAVPYQVHDEPDIALHPQTALLIAVLGMADGDFTGHKLADHIRPGMADYTTARRIVNGTDRAGQIAGYARIFERAIREAYE